MLQSLPWLWGERGSSGGSRHVFLSLPPAPWLQVPSRQGWAWGWVQGRGGRLSCLLARLRGCVSALQPWQLVKASRLFPTWALACFPDTPGLHSSGPVPCSPPVKSNPLLASWALSSSSALGIRWDLQLLYTEDPCSRLSLAPTLTLLTPGAGFPHQAILTLTAWGQHQIPRVNGSVPED